MVSLNEENVPKMDLPVDVTILRHPKEKKSKSSVIPSKILAPNQVEILHTLDVPDQTAGYGEDPNAVVLMFPSDDATEITEMSRE